MKSGKPSTHGSKTTGKSLPKAAQHKHVATRRAKRHGKAAGKQFVAQPKGAAKKTAAYRK